MSNELALKDPNQQKIEPKSGEFAKPDKTRQPNDVILGPKQVPDNNIPATPLRSAVGYRGASGIYAQRPCAELRKTRQANAVILEPKQEKAVEYMLAGASDSEIAKKLKVTRQTVNYWRNQDFDFIYELQMRRNQLWEGYRDELSDLYKMAVEEVKKSFKSKDPKIRLQVAMQILRLPALQENLKSKAPTDRKTIEAERYQSALSIALSEVTEELGYK